MEHQGPDLALSMQAAAEGDDVEDSGAEDGVYLFRPHTSYISGLKVSYSVLPAICLMQGAHMG